MAGLVVAEFLVLPNSCRGPGRTVNIVLSLSHHTKSLLESWGQGCICDAFCIVEENEAQRLGKTLSNFIY